MANVPEELIEEFIENVMDTKLPTANLPAANLPAENLPAANLPAENLPAANIPAANLLFPQQTFPSRSKLSSSKHIDNSKQTSSTTKTKQKQDIDSNRHIDS